uniref:Uncharacterized protein n=1 Tax=Placozoa sp. H2 TaxID=573895 RepID=A0A7I6NEB7_9METZ|nr:hypothetical protein [Placozoa sp. H2 HM-2017]
MNTKNNEFFIYGGFKSYNSFFEIEKFKTSLQLTAEIKRFLNLLNENIYTVLIIFVYSREHKPEYKTGSRAYRVLKDSSPNVVSTIFFAEVERNFLMYKAPKAPDPASILLAYRPWLPQDFRLDPARVREQVRTDLQVGAQRAPDPGSNGSPFLKCSIPFYNHFIMSPLITVGRRRRPNPNPKFKVKRGYRLFNGGIQWIPP